MPNVLVLFYSRHGLTEQLANAIARGIEAQGASALIRTVPQVCDVSEAVQQQVPSAGAPYCTQDELRNCDGLALGAPTHFGNMPAAMKYFWDQTTPLWIKGELIDKPACVFTASASLHGGQESTLLSMMLPLLHHGMIIAGLPYSESALHTTTGGGTPYGVSAVAKHQTMPSEAKLSADESSLAIAMGKRLAKLSLAQQTMRIK